MQSIVSHRTNGLKVEKTKRSRSTSPNPKDMKPSSNRKPDFNKQFSNSNGKKHPLLMHAKEPTTIIARQRYDE